MPAGKLEDLQGAITIAGTALSLWNDHVARMSTRVAAERIARLSQCKSLLEALKSGIVGARFQVGAATLTERELAISLRDDVQNVRDVLKSKGLSPARLKVWGVGLAMDANVTASVVAGADAVTRAAGGRGVDLVTLGLKQRELTAIAQKALLLDEADSMQATKRGASKRATSQRDQAIRDAYAIAWEIGAAGNVEFSPAGSDPSVGEHPDPVVQAAFQALADGAVLPSDRDRGKKKKPASEPTKKG